MRTGARIDTVTGDAQSLRDAAAKARGQKLGGVRRRKLTDAARAITRSIIAKRAADKAAHYAPVIRGIKAAGITSLVGIAAPFRARGIPTTGGPGTWQAVLVGEV